MITAGIQNHPVQGGEQTGPGNKAQSIGHLAKAAVAAAREAGAELPKNAQGLAASGLARGADPESLFASLIAPDEPVDDAPVGDGPVGDPLVDGGGDLADGGAQPPVSVGEDGDGAPVAGSQDQADAGDTAGSGGAGGAPIAPTTVSSEDIALALLQETATGTTTDAV